MAIPMDAELPYERDIDLTGAKKMKIGVLDLTCCTGCEANLLGTKSSISDYLSHFEISSWRMLEDQEPADYDVVLIEGYACNEEQVEVLKQARETSSVVVAFGTCAVSGNIFSQLKPENREKINAMVYGKGHVPVTKFVRPVMDVIKVDRIVRGCPANINDIQRLLQDLSRHPVTSKELKVFTPDYVARIEGHAKLKVNFQENKAHFYPEEGERFVEALVVGRHYESAPKYHSRICGICPVAHCLCATMAIEQALNIHVPNVARTLRKIFHCGQMIQSHLLHLYFMVLPAMEGTRSVMDMSLRHPGEFELVRAVKKVAEGIFSTIGAAPLHPVSLTPGGFTKVPDMHSLSALSNEIHAILANALDLALLFHKYENWPETSTNSHMLCLEPEFDSLSYPLSGDRVYFDGPEPYSVYHYLDFIYEKVSADQPAKTAFLKADKPVKTGALARLSRYFKRLHPYAQEAFEAVRIDFSQPFHNNLAQAVEILHYLEEALRLLDGLEEKELNSSLVNPKVVRQEALEAKGPWPKRGVAAIEAPRGVLFHEVQVDKDGKITHYNIVAPTNLNLSGLDDEINILLGRYSSGPDQIKKQFIEDLIRAMDPCITCSVH